jgi:hypothetical protein
MLDNLPGLKIRLRFPTPTKSEAENRSVPGGNA